MQYIITDPYLLNYTKKICRKYANKLYSIGFDIDDLMQECSLVYLTFTQIHGDFHTDDQLVINYKSAIHSKMVDLMRKNISTIKLEQTYAESFTDNDKGFYAQLAEFVITISEAPKQIKDFLNLTLEEGPNAKNVNKKLGLPRYEDIKQEVKDYFK